jgi:hypothetical protein
VHLVHRYLLYVELNFYDNLLSRKSKVERAIQVCTHVARNLALGVGLLILILDRRADRRIHETIHEQHLLINKMNKKIDEQNELIKNIQEIPSSPGDNVSNKEKKL